MLEHVDTFIEGVLVLSVHVVLVMHPLKERLRYHLMLLMIWNSHLIFFILSTGLHPIFLPQLLR
jgi:hypothetical protein